MLTRAQVRNATVTRLLGRTAADQRVFASRSIPIPQEALPAIRVFTPGETNASASIHVPVFRRTLQLGVEGVTFAATDAELDDAADNLAEEIKNALLTDAEWVAMFERVENIETGLFLDTESDRRRISAQILFSLRLATITYEPAVFDALDTVNVEVDVVDPPETPGPGGERTIEAEATIPITQD